MRRHSSLLALTHDHHHALRQARRLKLEAAGDAEQRLAQARRFLEFFANEGLTHFREEEEVLFPEVLRLTDSMPPFLAGALMDHVRIHALVGVLREEVSFGTVKSQTVTDVAEALQRHIRMEEKILFPQIEKTLGEEGLARLRFVARRRTA